MLFNLLLFKWKIVQRLFSTFADGWPGVGLLLLRMLTGSVMIHFGLHGLSEASAPVSFVPPVICIGCGTVLFVGLFTPVAGVIAAVTKGWIAFSGFSSHSDNPWIAVLQAILAAALAMTGPGAFSIDARRFGRKHINLSDR